MGFNQTMGNAASTIETMQNKDGGWGMVKDQESTIVNTSEALFVLHHAKMHGTAYVRGLEFLRSKTMPRLKKSDGRVRYASFALSALALCDPAGSTAQLQEFSSWLIAARNQDGGWGPLAGAKSDIFSTYLATQSLAAVPSSQFDFRSTEAWLLKELKPNNQWSLDGSVKTSHIANAYAILILSYCKSNAQRNLYENAIQELCEIKHWAPIEQEVGGTVWKHSLHAHAVEALLICGKDPYDGVIADAVRYVNSLARDGEGWSETDANRCCTIRSQYWSVKMFLSIQSAFDPNIHTLRINASHHEGNLREPEFLKFLMNTSLALVIPAKIYRFVVYTFLFITVLLILGVLSPALESLLSQRRGVAAICTFILIASWRMMSIRPKAFPKLVKAGEKILIVIVLLNLAFGPSIADFIAGFKELLDSLWNRVVK